MRPEARQRKIKKAKAGQVEREERRKQGLLLDPWGVLEYWRPGYGPQFMDLEFEDKDGAEAYAVRLRKERDHPSIKYYVRKIVGWRAHTPNG